MSSIIITIIAMALIALLAIAGTLYGGAYLTKTGHESVAARTINQSSQIGGALELYRVEHPGALPSSPQDLVDDGYLRTVPDSEWVFTTDAVVRPMTSTDDCNAINKKLDGDPAIPDCGSVPPEYAGCCTVGEGATP